MNNRLYEYMRLGKEEDEKRYKEELFDTKKITKISDADIEAYNKSRAEKHSDDSKKEEVKEKAKEEANSEIKEETKKSPVKTHKEPSYRDEYYKSETGFYHYRSPFKRESKKENKIETTAEDYTKVDETTLVMGLLGSDINSTLLPYIHKEISVVSDYSYTYNPFYVRSDNLETAVNGAAQLGIRGFNVDSSYTETIIPMLKAIGKSAFLLGEVDTLVLKEDGYYGFNTKVTGIKKAVVSDGVSLEDRNVLITGHDDSVKAFLLASCELKARNVVIITSEPDKFTKSINKIGATYEETDIYVLSTEDDYFYQINQLTTIQNFKWICFYTGADMPNDEDLFERIEIGYDMYFDRLVSEFTELLLNCHGQADNGLKMHIYSAIASYELWSGKKAPSGLTEYIYKKLKKKLY